MNNVKQMHFW